MDGHIDINEVTGPMNDAIKRLTDESAEIQRTVDAIEAQGKEESARAAAQVLRRAAEESAPYRQLVADKQAAADRFRLLIVREEQEAAQAAGPAAETRMDPVLPPGVAAVDHNGEVPQP